MKGCLFHRLVAIATELTAGILRLGAHGTIVGVDIKAAQLQNSLARAIFLILSSSYDTFHLRGLNNKSIFHKFKHQIAESVFSQSSKMRGRVQA